MISLVSKLISPNEYHHPSPFASSPSYMNDIMLVDLLPTHACEMHVCDPFVSCVRIYIYTACVVCVPALVL